MAGYLAEQLGMRPLVAHCHLGPGKLYRRTGKREQAHAKAKKDMKETLAEIFGKF